MMLPAQGPNTTLMEDMNVLGLSEGKKDSVSAKAPQVREPDEKGGDYAGPPGDKSPGDPGGDVDLQGDAAAGHYTYVPVRGDENVGPDGKYGGSRGGAKNEDIEEAASVGGKMIPSFMVPTAQEVHEQDERLSKVIVLPARIRVPATLIKTQFDPAARTKSGTFAPGRRKQQRHKNLSREVFGATQRRSTKSPIS